MGLELVVSHITERELLKSYLKVQFTFSFICVFDFISNTIILVEVRYLCLRADLSFPLGAGPRHPSSDGVIDLD